MQKSSLETINLLFNIYEIQIRNIKNNEFDQLHVIYCFSIPKQKTDKINYDKIVINLDFPNKYDVMKDKKEASKNDLLESIMNQIFNSGSNYTEVLITYLGNKHSWNIDTSSFSDLTESKLTKKDKNKLFKKIETQQKTKKEINDLLKQILKM